jgi:hypothetical protein
VGIAYQSGSEFVEPTFKEHLARVAGRSETRVACVIGAPKLMQGSRREVVANLRADVQALVLQARKVLDAQHRV